MLRFEISSSKTLTDSESDKRYVSYTIGVYQDHSVPDPKPSFIHRRYTHFLDLFNTLKKEQPVLMATINFPKKVMTGNFDPNLISCRSTGFESLLEHMAKDVRLREAPCTVAFFQNLELETAKKLMSDKKYDQALTAFENIFTLLNKVYTDRSRIVLISLCRLVACGVEDAFQSQSEHAALAGPTERWANLALRRFDGVSDAELLSLYVPLIKATITIWKTIGKDYDVLEKTLDDLKKRGMRVDNCLNLLDAVVKLEQNHIGLV